MRKLSLVTLVAGVAACSGRIAPEAGQDGGVTAAPAVATPKPEARATSSEQAANSFAEASAIAARGEAWLGATLARNEEGLRLESGRYLANGRAGEGVLEGDLDVAAEADAAEGLDLSIGKIARFKMHVTPVGAASVRGAVVGSRVAWSSIYRSTDALLVVGARFAEWAYLLRDAQAPRKFEFTASLPDSIKNVHRGEDGELLFDDARGEPVFRVQAPFVVDALGTKRMVRLAWAPEAHRFTLDVDPTGLVYPLVLDPTLDVPVWFRNSTTNPLNHDGPLVVQAPSSDKYWVLNGSPTSTTYPDGGQVYTPSGGTTWTSTFSNIPTGRRSAAGALDAFNRVTVFGGYDSGAINNWAVYSGGAWSDKGALVINSLAVPGRQGLGGAPFDVGTSIGRRAGTIFFGGNNLLQYFDDVLAYDGSAFARITPSGTGPSGRTQMVFTSNGASRVIVAGGSNSSTRYSDTWGLIVSSTGSAVAASWTLVCATGACGYSARNNSASAYDPTRNRVIMVGGDTGTAKLADVYEISPVPAAGSKWTAICGGSLPACHASMVGRSGASMACDKSSVSGITTCYMMGGVGASNAALHETWAYHVRGNACTSDSQCDTNSCQDGACCANTTTCGTCRACNNAGSEGLCSYVPSGTAHTTCPAATSACNGAGICKLAKGQACSPTDPAACLSGYCVDGFCCDKSCRGSCDVCSVVAGGTANGTCSLLTAGKPGQPACSSGALCSGTSSVCPGGCATDVDCSDASYCSATGKCVARKDLGAACDAAVDCLGASCRMCTSNNCVDGVCCDRACDGLCEACSKTRKGTITDDGLCGYAADGVPDRKGGCVDSGTGDAGCKTDGKCSGAGACRLYSATTTCGDEAATCVGNQASGRFCNGTGTCTAAGEAKDCAPYKCVEGTGCPSSCTVDTDCFGASYCAGSICVPKQTIGKTCAEARECDSGLCIDGNCCERPCDSQCEACDVKGAEGKCAPVIGPPHGARPACAAGPEGKPCEAPSCDGTVRESCLGRPGANVICQEKSCTGNVEKPEARCDGKGTCAASETRTCQPYTCALDACRTSCTSNDECQAPTTCDTTSGKCITSSKCDADGFTSVSADGTTRTDCRPFLCDATGSCIKQCVTSADCSSPFICDSANKACVQPADAGSTDDGGCSAGTGRGTTGSAFLFVAALGALARRRRPRAVA